MIRILSNISSIADGLRRANEVLDQKLIAELQSRGMTKSEAEKRVKSAELRALKQVGLT